MRFDPFSDAALDDPYPQYVRFREREPVHWSEKLHAWVLFDYAQVAAAFRDDAHFSADRRRAGRSRLAPGDTALRTVSSDPPESVPIRAMLNASLGPRVRAIGPRVDELIGVLLEHVAAAAERVVERTELAGEVDLVGTFAYPLPIEVIAELLDVPEAQRPRLRERSAVIARGMDRFYSGDEVMTGLREIGADFLQLVLERRGTAGDDLVRRLLDAQYHGDRLTEVEVVAMCSALVFAGHETTANLIANGMRALLRDPDAAERLRAEPELAAAAVEELLRFDSPAQFMSRVVTGDFALGDVHLAAGESVLLGIGPANRDPAVFHDPDRLDLGRSPNPHLAFGLGTHVCPGAQLSRIEARAAIPALLRRFPRLRLGREPAVQRRTMILRGLERLPVRVD